MSDFEEIPARGINLQRYLDLLLRRAWLVAVCGVGMTAAAFLYAQSLPSFYTATATMLVEPQQREMVEIGGSRGSAFEKSDMLNTVVDMLRSRSLMEQVVSQRIFRERRLAGGKTETEGDVAALAAELGFRTGVGLRPETRLIDITVENRDPELARDYAQAIYDEFVKRVVQQMTDSTLLANRYLLEEEERLRGQLQASESALQAYREEHGEVFIDDRQSLLLQQLQQISAQAIEARNARANLESDLQVLEGLEGSDTQRALELVSIAELPTVASARAALAGAESDFAVLKERYLSLHPKYIAAASRVEELQRALDAIVRESQDVILKQRLKIARDREARINQLLEEQQTNVLEMQRLTIPYDVLKRQADSDRALYEAVVTRLKETTLAPATVSLPYRLAEPPVASGYPDRPNRKRIVLAGVALGLMLGVGLIVLLDLLNPAVRDEWDILDAGPVVLGKVGAGRAGETLAGEEAYRSLRTTLAALPGEATRRLLLVPVSGGPAPTEAALRLATAFARQGTDTLLADTDFHGPTLSGVLGRKGVNPPRTLEQVLASGGEVFSPAEALPGTPQLWVFPAGQASAEWRERLSGGLLAPWLEQWQSQFSTILVVTAPLAEVRDAVSLLGSSRYVCLLVEQGRTRRDALREAIAAVQSVPHGLVLIRRGTPGRG